MLRAFGTSSAAYGTDGFMPLSQLSLPQKTTPLLKELKFIDLVVYGKAEKVIDVALIVDDGTGWIRKWFCVLTEKFSVSLLILIFSFTFSFCFMEFKTSFDLFLTQGWCMSTLTVEM
ncbi:hypothetical protein NC651_017420 [Populus alba x Populus x berolinensis]|nr:hypothetical protein NC651_017420 [Populus alba x Populus x berolinensis]